MPLVASLRRLRRRLLVHRRGLAALLAALAVLLAVRATTAPPPALQPLLVAADDLPGGTVLDFPTATAAARTLQDLRIRRPFIRAALDVTEVPLDGSRPLLDGLAAVARCLEWAAASPPGVVLLSDLACQLLTASADLRCEPSPTQDGVHRLVPVAQPSQMVPLP